MAGNDYDALRSGMVERQLRNRGIEDERVLAAMNEVPRERFVPNSQRRRAYSDSALPIGEGQTISQPWIVAAICQALALKGTEKVLEIGTGSGYSAAVLSHLASEVLTIERIEELAEDARHVLTELGAANVEVIVADGSVGLPDRAPFDGIAVHATAPEAPPSLVEQLADGGRLVIPIATDRADMLTLYERSGDELTARSLGPCRFVPLIGDEAFEPRTRRARRLWGR
jgi:protein-L-isoaspartate(D-aspartate) O-methyltransferase